MHFHIITLFPKTCRAYTDASVLGRAQQSIKEKSTKKQAKKLTITYYNPRDFTTDKHRRVDDRPYGGGPGMVLQAEPIIKAWQKAVGRKKDKQRVGTLIMSPRGDSFDQAMAKQFSLDYDHLVLICGRYEGIDGRVETALKTHNISVGPYTLTGGELPALTIVDATARYIEGVLGDLASLEENRVAGGEFYTRPETFTYQKKTYGVPEVFLSGHHQEIEKRRAE